MRVSPRSILPSFRSHTQAFSLVEVSLAIGIIAVAFVSLLGMLPIGMGVHRDARDSTNENWIFQSVQSKILSTDWKDLMPRNVGDEEETSRSNYAPFTYYYDVEGKLLRREGSPRGRDPEPSLSALTEQQQDTLAETYKVKVIDGPQRLAQTTGQGQDEALSQARLFAVLMVNVNNKKAASDLDAINSLQNLRNLPKGLRVKTFLVSKMDSSKDEEMN